MPSKDNDLQAQQTQTQLVPMPAGGLYELAQQLYAADAGDDTKMREAVHELWLLNNDTLRTEDSHIVGQLVKVPAQ
jgi:hypothetical protein